MRNNLYQHHSNDAHANIRLSIASVEITIVDGFLEIQAGRNENNLLDEDLTPILPHWISDFDPGIRAFHENV